MNIKNFIQNKDNLFLIAGPCVIEDEYTMFKTAEKLKDITNNLKIPLIFKSSFMKDNRSSLKNFIGPGLKKGLEILNKIKKEFAIPITSDVHYPEQIEEAAQYLDIIQIPAYLCMQTTLLVTAAKTGRIINIKHGQFLSPMNMKYPIKKVEESGNLNIIITERGYTFGYNDLIVDPRTFYILRKIGYPVVFDITHTVRKYGIPSSSPSGGNREYLTTIARAGVASGVNGLFIEVHPKPSCAKCDAASQINVNSLEDFLKPLLDINKIVKKYNNFK